MLHSCLDTAIPPDPRRSDRTSLLIRPIKLVSRKDEFLCLVRDISVTGVSIRSFHDLPPMDDVRLESQTGETLEATAVWQMDRRAGFAFKQDIDVESVIAEMGLYPKRPLRFELSTPATLFRAGQPTPATILNLSQQGAKLQTTQRLSIGELVRIEDGSLPSLVAKVCWRDGELYGVVFETRFTLADFAVMAARMQQPKLLARAS
ncbi:PilZ domain-containing protein [Altererythrobacter arenosus]|uniref:PilZ domain-containing protein n=1 Tax=Altererythrobacter arenosus TaxID=3032592 RepID=A0ABY8FYE5_9SPHN|nr:PilZ domain-containing protein [Altererythrobacter sp. CAU 1644]WFL79053.1 PilZ domain-containing protein [Altererythrobacter sp. CAU 1644]